MSAPTELWQGQYDKLFIGGQWVTPASDRVIEVVSPASEQTVARVPEAVEADVDAAVAAARDAFDNGPWPRLPLDERIAVLRKLSTELAAHETEAARLVSAEMGCPITLSTKMQAMGPRLLLDAFLDLAPAYPWSDTRRSATGHALVTREPVGVVAAIVPWNAPLLITMIKLAPALLAGCTMVVKPSPETPLDAYLLGHLLERAGLPAGVVNIVPAQREVSEHLVRHRGVDKVSFTGSTAAGRRIAALCGKDLRRVTLELGGKSAAVLLEDADLDAAIAAVRAVSLRNSGQVCSNKTRIVVARSRRDELHDRLVDLISSMPVGDPLDPATEVGPMVSAAQRTRVEGYIAEGKASGSKVLVGGGRPEGLGRGWYVAPTVFADVDPDAKIAQEEIFGPVLTVHTFDTEAEAVAIANNSEYGLNGSVFAADPERALSVARRIRTGTVEVNGNPVGFTAPIGGFKNSGIGREAGLEGFDAYVELKSYGLPH
ncbi:aldehyde dehydrogenase [Amycolatopsis regifaucium]|uniref:aldehyde dehydrogenase (NAD(+)) n=1 Tax=Amycolatopsis regifaucium TaxID=546365 RepID=A0A154MG25_9PSEU|nr:aldehyde dehydrogenase [Amycolatopsis regifaucium]KZB83130.1 aldehyde dehydrogenase [Amycolatopsis regifaucium]OKA03215.1 aldehyde dehydrogenase [Amycolatopsis regifaucium]SFJ46872.1 Acyl-CoA reductase [Amycolatopsis regifaucium]